MTPTHRRTSRVPFVTVPQAWIAALTSDELKVAIAIGAHADRRGQAFPSIRTLMRETDLSRNTVRKALAGLSAKRVLSIEARQRENGSATSHLFTIDLTGTGFQEGWHGLPQPDPGVGHSMNHGGSCRNPGWGHALTQEGSDSDPGDGSSGDPPELDPFLEPDPQEPLSPPTPSRTAGSERAPTAFGPEPEQPSAVPDRMAARYRAYPWLDAQRRPLPEFLEHVIRALPKKADRAEAVAMARAYLRKAGHLEGRLEAIEDLWADFTAERDRQTLSPAERERQEQERQWREHLARMQE